MIFRYDLLKDFLIHARSVADVFPLREWRGQVGTILRHDVDLDVGPAWRLAQIERDAGVRSSYFIMTTAQTYNAASPRNRALLREMAEEGFEIGLHFDPTVYDRCGKAELEAAALAEAAQLGAWIGHEVRSVSLHNPSVNNEYPLFQGLINAYDASIFNPDIYLSDSRMIFRRSPYDFVAAAADKTIQLLLHPLHFTKDGGDYRTIMADYVLGVCREVDTVFSVNMTYRQTMGENGAARLIAGPVLES